MERQISKGTVFQSFGAQTEKALSPYVLVSDDDDDDNWSHIWWWMMMVGATNGDDKSSSENSTVHRLPNAVEHWSSLSSNVPSDVASGPLAMMSRFVRVMLSRIFYGERKKRMVQEILVEMQVHYTWHLEVSHKQIREMIFNFTILSF